MGFWTGMLGIWRGLRSTRGLSGRPIRVSLVAAVVAVACIAAARPGHAEDAVLQQEILFQQTLHQPGNLEAAFAFARVATANGDYEAAIGALERVQFFQPGLARVKYELGALYFRLRSYEMARRYFKEALACRDIDALTRDRIETALPDAEKQLQQSRLSGFLQGGVRYQSNATYAPNGGVVSLGGLDLALLPSATKKPDGNLFGLVGINHDYELDNGRGDTLETRFAGYGTDQFRFHDLNVGLAELTFGPRFVLAPELMPGVTVKPYLVGGNTWVGGGQYLSAVGAGISASIPVAPRLGLTPGFEWNRVDVDTGSALPVSTFNSGDWFTTSLAAVGQLNERLTLRVQGLYRRGTAATTFFDFNQWEADAALTYAFPSLLGASLNWSVTPFGRVVRTAFDAPNPTIDPLTRRRDTEWTAGVIFDTPISKTFGVSTTVQYDRTGSTLPNYRQDNLSAMTGPTVRF